MVLATNPVNWIERSVCLEELRLPQCSRASSATSVSMSKRNAGYAHAYPGCRRRGARYVQREFLAARYASLQYRPPRVSARR
jgi:hypothetical protein